MMLLVQIAVAAVVALAVVALTHLFTSRRVANKRREQRISYLVGAFRLLAKANHHPRLYEIAGEVQQAVADIQLFGTPKQVAMAREFAMELGTKQAADIDGLLVALRDDLRAELGADVITDGFVWLRIDRKDDPSEAPERGAPRSSTSRTT